MSVEDIKEARRKNELAEEYLECVGGRQIKGEANMELLEGEKQTIQEVGCIGLLLIALAFDDKETAKKRIDMLISNQEELKMLCDRKT